MFQPVVAPRRAHMGGPGGADTCRPRSGLQSGATMPLAAPAEKRDQACGETMKTLVGRLLTATVCRRMLLSASTVISTSAGFAWLVAAWLDSQSPILEVSIAEN